MTQTAIKKINTLFFVTSSVKNDKINKTILWTLLTILFLALMSYAYFVNNTIMNVVERKDIENSIGELNSEISVLETKYMSDGANITEGYAKSIGYKTAYNVKYISLDNKTNNLTVHVVEE